MVLFSYRTLTQYPFCISLKNSNETIFLPFFYYDIYFYHIHGLSLSVYKVHDQFPYKQESLLTTSPPFTIQCSAPLYIKKSPSQWHIIPTFKKSPIHFKSCHFTYLPFPNEMPIVKITGNFHITIANSYFFIPHHTLPSASSLSFIDITIS